MECRDSEHCLNCMVILHREEQFLGKCVDCINLELDEAYLEDADADDALSYE